MTFPRTLLLFLALLLLSTFGALGQTVTTNAATAVTDLAATLNGTVNPQGTGGYYPSFELGTTTNYDRTITGTITYVSGSTATAITANYSSLQPGTTYHYRLKVTGAGTYYGADMTFTTAPPATPPTVGTVTASAFAQTATLHVSNVAAGSSQAAVFFEYGPTTAYGATAIYNSAILAGSSSSYVSVTVGGLTPSTLYHYRCKAINDQGTAYSTDGTFTTPALPVLTTLPATNMTDLFATLNGTANAGGATLNVYFQFGTDLNYGTTANPSQSSISGNTTTPVSAYPSVPLLPGTTYHYRLVASDSNYNYYYGPDATFTTAPPATPPSLTTGSASPVGVNSATVSVSTFFSPGSSPATLYFDYGTTSSYGSQVVYPSVFASGTYGSQTMTLTGLAPGTTYHYRARAVNTQGSTSGADATFTTLPLPTITTNPATAISDISATLNGKANANGGSFQVAFEYGLTTAYGSSVAPTQATASGTSTVVFMANPPGLLANTTYHYRLRLSDSFSSFYGNDATFTTFAPGTPPTANTDTGAGVSATTAILGATGVYSGSSPALIVFDYGLTPSYGSTLIYVTEQANQSYSRVRALLTGLQPQTTYHFRVRATNAQGTALGSDMTFTTLGLPTVTTNGATSITDSGATLNATVNPADVNSTASFEYGLTTGYGSSITPANSSVSGTSPIVVSAALAAGLQPSATYHYRVRLDNVDGTYYGADSVFTTAAPGSPPSVSYSGYQYLGSTKATLYASAIQAGSSPASLAFEYGATSSYGAQAVYPGTIAAGTTLDFASLPLSGLSPNTVYHFRARVTSNQGTAYSPDAILTTASLPVVTTAPATSVTDISGVLNGNATVYGGYLNLYFEYGKTTSFGSTAYPNPSSLSGNTSSSLSGWTSQLSPNTTYHYRLRGTNSAGESYYGADQTFVTAPPSTLPTISTGAPSFQATLAALRANNIMSGGSPATVSWDYGLTTSYGSTQTYPSAIPTGTKYDTMSVSVTGLTPATTYHCRAVITNAQATVYGADVMFTTPPASVAATTLPATRIRSTAATLNGSYQTNTSDSVLTFDYGLDINYGLSANAVSSSTRLPTVSASLSGLAPATTYHFRLVNHSQNGTAYGTDMTFTTLATGLPVAITGTALANAGGGATFRGIVNASGFSTTPVVEYGLTTSYGTVASLLPTSIPGNTDVAVNATVAGLSQFATYHYRVVATNAQGTTYGDDATVTIAPPALGVTGSAYPFSASATLYGTAIISGPPYYFTNIYDTYFEYGPTTDYGTTATPDFPYNGFGSGTVYAQVGAPYIGSNTPPLQPNTTYHYRFVVVSNGGTSYGDDATFTTEYALPIFAYQPTTTLTSSTVTLNATVTEAGATDSVRFDYGLDNTYGTTVAATPATVSGTATTPVSLTLSGLTPGTTYHYRVNASRASSNGTRTFPWPDQTFTTLTLAENWKQQNFGTSANSGATADAASFSGDGVANLIKYALGLDPTVPNAGLLPPGTPKNDGGATYLSYTFPRDPTKTDLTYEVIVADNLNGPWTPIASSSGGAPTTGPGFVSETPGAGGIMSVEVHDTVSTASAGQRFLRLRITH